MLDNLIRFLFHDLLETVSAFLVDWLIRLPGKAILFLFGRGGDRSGSTDQLIVGGLFWVAIIGGAYLAFR